MNKHLPRIPLWDPGEFSVLCVCAGDHSSAAVPAPRNFPGVMPYRPSGAIFGIIIKACWITCPKWFSSILYIAMGWVCVFAFGPLFHSLPLTAFLWLLGGGIIYTIGGVIYALKLPVFNSRFKSFGSHELFHLFVMGGSICHFIFMYLYVA